MWLRFPLLSTCSESQCYLLLLVLWKARDACDSTLPRAVCFSSQRRQGGDATFNDNMYGVTVVDDGTIVGVGRTEGAISSSFSNLGGFDFFATKFGTDSTGAVEVLWEWQVGPFHAAQGQHDQCDSRRAYAYLPFTKSAL